MTFPMKNSVLDHFPSWPPAHPPLKSANFIFIVVSTVPEFRSLGVFRGVSCFLYVVGYFCISLAFLFCTNSPYGRGSKKYPKIPEKCPKNTTFVFFEYSRGYLKGYFLEDRNLLKLRRLDSSCPFFLSDNSILGR